MKTFVLFLTLLSLPTIRQRFATALTNSVMVNGCGLQGQTWLICSIASAFQ